MKEEERILLKTIGNRERLLTKSEYLSNKENQIEDDSIRSFIIKEKIKVNKQIEDLENQLKGVGLPFYDEEIAVIFSQINSELNQIKSPDELVAWLKLKSPDEYLNQIEKAYEKNKKINSKIVGKWVGRFISEDEYQNIGEFSFGICQIGSKIFGYGALLDSLYTNVFLKGMADEDEINVEVYSESVNLKSMFNGSINEFEGNVVINGSYHVEDGFDKGKIESIIERGIIKLSSKGEKLVLFSELRKVISSGDSTTLIEVLDKLNETKYENEIIIHKKRINNLNQSKRMGILSYSEAQLEESKIVNDILNLISEIESNYRKN